MKVYPYIIWLVVWNMNFMFPYIGNVIIPTDSCFSEGLKLPIRYIPIVKLLHIN